MKKILLVNVSPVVSSILINVISNIAGIAVSEFHGSVATIGATISKKWDLAIIDAGSDAGAGLELVEKVLSAENEIPVIVLGADIDVHHAKMYLQYGAKGFLGRTATPNEVQKAIKSVLSGSRYVNEDVEAELVKDLLSGRSVNPFDNLSDREVEILRLMMEGKTVTAISQQLSLKPSTISTFRARIFNKMKTRDVGEIKVMAKIYNVN
jgi:DNA-binding NarL/FixJ family response regulator